MNPEKLQRGVELERIVGRLNCLLNSRGSLDGELWRIIGCRVPSEDWNSVRRKAMDFIMKHISKFKDKYEKEYRDL